MKKKLILAIKLSLSFLAIWIVLSKVDINQTSKILENMNFVWMFVAFVFFTLSRIAGSFRMSLYFDSLGMKLGQAFNLKLYYLGMFYNLFLPGGIGGDGYKVYFLNKHYGAKIKDLVNALLQDRISGLFALILLLCFLASFSSFVTIFQVGFWWLFLCSLFAFLGIYFLSKITKKFHSFFVKGFFVAFILQVFQLLSAVFILISFGEFSSFINYLTIFLISSIVSVLPISFGGIGARELTFVYLLDFLHQSSEIGVALSVVFFIFTAFSSLFGAFFMNLKPSQLHSRIKI